MPIFLAGLSLFCYIFLYIWNYWAGCSLLLFDHVRSRVDRFLDPSTGDTYQIDRSLEAFSNGGLFGTGPGEGKLKIFYLMRIRVLYSRSLVRSLVFL
ncbi:MAG: hypothetical protein CM15mP62_20550 [Rhodospirillaceae bacterium]|nr:MAG: hypothetical protein CM15mP62_20550 [Rhodospirillaceae bacterium]